MIGYGLTQFLPSISNFVFAFVIIRYYQPVWWGNILELQLYYYLSVAFVNWGNRDWLLERGSRDQGRIREIFSQAFFVRSFLFIPVVLLVLFSPAGFSSEVVMHLLCWIVFRYIHASFEVLMLWERRYTGYIITEILSVGAATLILLFFQETLSYQHVLFLFTGMHFIRALILCMLFRAGVHIRRKVSFNLLVQAWPFAFVSFVNILLLKFDMLYAVVWLDKQSIAAYQVLLGFVMLIQYLPNLFLAPYLKNIYRMSGKAASRLQLKVQLGGLVVTAAGMVITVFLTKKVYLLSFSITQYMLASVIAYLPFTFFISTYRMYATGKSRHMVYVQLFAIVLSLSVGLYLVPVYGVTGVLLTILAAWTMISAGMLFMNNRI